MGVGVIGPRGERGEPGPPGPPSPPPEPQEANCTTVVVPGRPGPPGDEVSTPDVCSMNPPPGAAGCPEPSSACLMWLV